MAGLLVHAETGRIARLASFREIFGIDLSTLALFRIGLGGLILLSTCLRARDLTAHYTDFGTVPRAFAMELLAPASWSIHLANGSALFQGFLFFVAGFAALGLIAGYRTRLMTVVCWALLVSVANRNTGILSGEDQLLTLLAFWAMFLPLGARFSVDAALDPSDEKTPNRYFSVATLALLVQGVSMYFFSAILKSDAKWIPDGTAVYYATQLDYFATPFAHWFRQFPEILQGLTYTVWAIEIAAPILLFLPVFHRPVRIAMVALLMSMHFGFFLCLEIGLFSFVSILMNAAFIQGWVWDRLSRRRGVGDQCNLTIYYDRDCSFCLKTCRLLRVFLILPEARIVPAQDVPEARELLEAHNSWVVRQGDGDAFLKWDAIRYLVGLSPLFAPFEILFSAPPTLNIGDRIYRLIAAHRLRLSRITAVLLPWRTQSHRTSVPVNAIAAGCLALVCVQNVSTIPAAAFRMPETLRSAREALGLYQNWTMFAPYPEVTSAWPVIVGRLTDGTIVDVYNKRRGAPDWEKPGYVSQVFRNDRWRKLLSNIEDRTYDDPTTPHLQHYARYLCRDWNWKLSRVEDALATFDIHFQVEWTQPDYRPKKLVRRHVWSHDCFG